MNFAIFSSTESLPKPLSTSKASLGRLIEIVLGKYSYQEETKVKNEMEQLILRGEKNFIELGSGDNFVDVVRYFYRETVKKYKKHFKTNDDFNDLVSKLLEEYFEKMA